MSRYVSWFSTKSGRKFTHWCVGTLAFSVFGNHIAFHGLCLDRVKEIFQVYNRGQPRQLSPKVNSLIEEVLHDSNLKEEQKKKLNFFYVVGHETFHAGGINSPWGGIIGIPFFFEDIKDINFSEVRIVGKETVDWIIDGQDFIKAVTLTDNAKKFAILKEIYSCNFSDALVNAAIGASCIIFPATFAKNINVRTNAFEKLRLGQRCIRYCIFYCIGLVFYRLLKDPLKHLSQRKADELAAETGIDYLNGGIEYYKKTLLKNKALRQLAGSRLKRHYNEDGNENYFIMTPKLPVSKRLDYLRNVRKEKMGIVEENIE